MKILLTAIAFTLGLGAAQAAWACECNKKQDAPKACACEGGNCPATCSHDGAKDPAKKPDKKK